MTVEEIIKAWEKVLSTGDSPIGEHWGCSVTTKFAKETLDMLKRQKAEIERLKKNYSFLHKRYCDMMQTKIDKSVEELIQDQNEAYKEIIAKLKEHLCSYDLPDYHSFRAVDEDVIDEVLEEMVGK